MRMNQAKPIRLSLDQASRIVWLLDDLLGRQPTAAERAVIEPLVAQIALIHAQGRGKTVDKSP